MDFHQEYIVEVKQILKSLESSLLELEKKAHDPEEINNVYRYLHTIKGSAGMFGFETIEQLTHELEHVFSDIRDGDRQVDHHIIDLTLHAVDVLSDLIEGKDAKDEVQKLLETLGSATEEPNSTPDAQTMSESIEKVFIVVFRPEPEIFKRGINIEAILDDIKELGTTKMYVHNETTPYKKQISDKKLESFFEIIVQTEEDLEEVQDVFMFLKPSEYIVLEVLDLAVLDSKEYTDAIALNEKEKTDRTDYLTPLLPEPKKEMAPSTKKVEISSIQDLNIDAEKIEEKETDTNKITNKSKKSNHINVSTQKLDQLINIVSELVIFRSEIQHITSSIQNPALHEAMEKLDQLTLRLRDSAFHIRLVPLNIITVKMQRLIRSVSRDLGKEINFITEGMDTELDRSMIASLEAPIMHMIRNAIDHGIETPDERKQLNKPEKGLLKFYSYNSGDHVFIQIQDDGKGIDFDKVRAKGIERGLIDDKTSYSEKELINLMMSPGFSTASEVTTVSGRGVGMDVVKRDINALRGEVEVSTEKGLGSIFTLRLPLTLTILDTLVVQVKDNKYLLPINEIEYCYTTPYNTLFNKKSRQLNHEGKLISLVSLREYFEVHEKAPENGTVIIINKNDTAIALVVDKIIGKLQTVYRPLNEMLQSVHCFSGASILGDGSIALIINALKLNK